MGVREEIVANALWGVDHEPDIHYSQGAHRFDAVETPRALPLYTDCSGFATLCYAWAGAPDPNGRGYNHTGYTGTLLTNLPEISMEQAQIGDLIVYGPAGGDHVVVIVETGQDPLCVSHGQERGPFRIRHSAEAASHRYPVRVLQGVTDSVEQLQPEPVISQPQEEVMKATYMRPDDSPGVALVFDTGSIVPVTNFANTEEVFVKQLGVQIVNYEGSADSPDETGQMTRRVWVTNDVGLKKAIKAATG